MNRKEFKGLIPIVETSSHENINVDQAFFLGMLFNDGDDDDDSSDDDDDDDDYGFKTWKHACMRTLCFPDIPSQ